MERDQRTRDESSLSPERVVASVRYSDWKGQIQMAMDLDQLVRIVRAYLATWQPEQLRELPIEVGSTALSSSEDIAARAVLAAHAELKARHGNGAYELLREMSLTLGAAASRLRYLTTMRTRERIQ